MARPTKFIPEITDTIIKAVSIGATYKDAAEAAGVDYTTFQAWMNKGQAQTKGEFFTFFYAIRRAEANARNNYLSTIAQAAAKGDWKAAAWWLSHRARGDYGDNVDVTSKGNALTVQIIPASKDVNADNSGE